MSASDAEVSAVPARVQARATPPSGGWRWRVGCVLALVGAALLAYACWAPWAYIYGPILSEGHGPVVVFSLFMVESGSIGSFLVAFGVTPVHAFELWSVVTVLGLLACPFLWLASRPVVARVALAVYTAWFVVMVGGMVWFARILSVAPRGPLTGNDVNLPWSLVFSPLLQLSGEGDSLLNALPVAPNLAFVSVNAALVLVAVGTALIALILLWSTRPITLSTASQAWTGRSLVTVATMTIGSVLWAVGYFVVPWATALVGPASGPPVLFLALYERMGRSPLPYPVYDFAKVPSRLPVDPLALDPLVALYALSALLLGGACLLVLTVWLGRLSRGRLLCGVLWFALTAGTVLFGSLGVLPAEPAYPERYTSIGTGPLVSAFGLLLVAVGLASGLVVGLRQRRALARE